MPETSPDSISTRATLGLGGNLDNPVRAMALALRTLDARADCRVGAVSRLYRTPPWGKTDQSFFYNSCAAVDTTLSPEALLDVCLGIERDMKRVRIERWGPRTIDIDILTYGDIERAEPLLTIPHPRMTERGFCADAACRFRGRSRDQRAQGDGLVERNGCAGNRGRG